MLVGVPSHHGNRKAIAGESHSSQQLSLGFRALAPDTVHQSQGTPTHGGDIAEVHQNTTPASEPWVVLHEAGMHALAGQQQLTVLARQQGCIVTQHPSGPQLREGTMGKRLRCRLDVALGKQTALLTQRSHQRPEIHAAMGEAKVPAGRNSLDGT